MSGLYRGPAPVDPDADIKRLPEDPHRGLDALLTMMLSERASDLHIQADEAPWVRKDGNLMPLPQPGRPDQNHAPLSRTTVSRMCEMLLAGPELRWFERANAVAKENMLKSETAQADRVAVFRRHEERGLDTRSDPVGFDADTAYEFGDHARFRVNISFQRNSPRIVLRQIPTGIKSLEQLGMPDTLAGLATLRRGLVLVTGPTGSGKTTTLAALIHEINATRASSILTIEDPIEFVHKPLRSMITQREVGQDTASFAAALRSGLRQDPDVILLGEMRDLETMRVGLEAAETGHLVLGTLHTKSAKDTVTRIVAQYPEGEQSQVRQALAGSLRAVVGQVLVPKRGGGRVAATEIMHVTPAIRAQLRTETGFKQIEDQIRSSGASHGNRLMDDHLLQLVVDELVEPADALAAAINRSAFEDALRRAARPA